MATGHASSINKRWSKEIIVSLEKPFNDERGMIQLLVNQDMKSALLITSKKGTVRANHYHKSDWHYCYVLSGSIEYFYRNHGEKGEPKHVVVVKDEMFFTPPMVEHAMKFLEDTTFLTFSGSNREQEAYEDDVIRVELIR